MASKSLGTLTLDLVAKTGGFVAGMSKAEKATEKWRKKVTADAAAAGKFIGTALAAATVAAAAGLVVLVKRSIEAIDAQSEMARRLKTSYESLTTLARAGDMAGVSMQQIEVASRSLDVNLGKAAQGAIAQADALAKLGLSAEELSKLPLDEKLLKINQALKENVSETERAAVAADLYGSRAQAAIQQLSPDVIAEAARQMEIFGLNLSQIEAEKVEQAADAMGVFGLLIDGIGTQLTVELAPALSAVGQAFLDSAEEAGGLGTVVQETTRDSIRALAFLIDAADGVGVAFRTAARSIGLVGSIVVENLAKAGATAAKIAKYTPQGAVFNFATGGLDKTRQQLEEISGLARAAGNDFVDLVTADIQAPLAGAELLTFYDKAQEKGQAAAAASVNSAEGQKVYAGTLKNTSKALSEVAQKQDDAIANQIKSLQFQAETVGKTADEIKLLELANDGASESQLDLAKAALSTVDAYEKNTKAQEDYQSLIKDLRTDEEKLNDQLNERLAVLTAISNVPAAEQEQTKSRIAAAAFSDSPDYQGLAPEVGGALGESFKIADAQAELEAWYATQLAMLEEYRTEHAELNTQWNEQEQALAQEHADKLSEIDRARSLVAYGALEETFGALSGLARQFAGEQSDAYKVLFAAEKAAAIARSIVAIQTALAQASASAPFPANLAAMATVAAQTASIVATISSVAIQGQAHDGLMSVPKTGTYLLEKGERVTTANTSAKLDKTLEETKKNRAQSAPNLRVVNAFDRDEVVGGYMGSSSGEKVIMNVVRRNRRTIQSLSSGGA